MAEEKHSHRLLLLFTVATYIALAILIYSIRHQILDTFRSLSDVNSLALLLIIPLEAINYHSYTRMYQGMFKILDVSVPYKEMFKVSLEVNFINNIFPSGGFSTFSYMGTRLKEFDVPAAKSTLIQMMRFAITFISFQVFLFGGLFVLAINGRANDVMMLITASVVSFLFAITSVFFYVIGSEKRIHAFFGPLILGTNKLVRVVWRRKKELIDVDRSKQIFSSLSVNFLIIKKNIRLLKKPFYYSLIANLTDVLTIYSVFIAFDKWVNPGAVIIGFAVANVGGVLAVHSPGGVGIYEGTMAGVMAAAGVPPGVVLPAAVMYRVLSQSVQLPPGWYFYRKFIKSRYSNHKLSNEPAS